MIAPVQTAFGIEELEAADEMWAGNEEGEWRIICYEDGHTVEACARHLSLSWLISRTGLISITLTMTVVVASCSVLLLITFVQASGKAIVVAHQIEYFLGALYLGLGVGCAFILPCLYFVFWVKFPASSIGGRAFAFGGMWVMFAFGAMWLYLMMMHSKMTKGHYKLGYGGWGLAYFFLLLIVFSVIAVVYDGSTAGISLGITSFLYAILIAASYAKSWRQRQ